MLSDELLLETKFGTSVATDLPSPILALNVQSVTVSDAEVSKLMKTVKNRSAPSPDAINYKIRKYFNKRYPTSISSLFTGCVEMTCFPEVWKPGKVVWLPKPGKDPSSPDVYRPITLLSTLGKMLERVIVKRIDTFISQYNTLENCQYGFRAKCGTEDAISQLLHETTRHRETHPYVAILTIDISGAFDNLKWSCILEEMECNHYPDYLLALVTDFLHGRKISSGETSTTLTRGCPQGSVLGPTLWNIGYNRVIKTLRSAGLNVI